MCVTVPRSSQWTEIRNMYVYTNTHRDLQTCLYLFPYLSLSLLKPYTILITSIPVQHYRLHFGFPWLFSPTVRNLAPITLVYLLEQFLLYVAKLTDESAQRWFLTHWPSSFTGPHSFLTCNPKVPQKKGKHLGKKISQKAQLWTWTLPIWATNPRSRPWHS